MEIYLIQPNRGEKSMYKKTKLQCSEMEEPIEVTQIYAVYNYIFSPQYRFHGEYHDAWELVVCGEGMAVIEFDGKEVTLTRDQMFLHTPNEQHNITPHAVTRVGTILFSADSPDLYKIADRVIDCGKYDGPFSILINEGILAFSGMNGALQMENYAPDYGAKQLSKIMLEYFLICIMRNEFPSDNKKPRNNVSNPHTSTPLVNDILTYMRNNVERPLTLDTLAAKFNYSKEYICALFKKTIGESPIEYFNILRIEKAKQLLALNFYSINDIYKKLNYCSPQHFSAQFKKIASVTPAEFAKNCKRSSFENWWT